MKQTPFKYHVFFCTNIRENGESACGQHNSQEMRDYAKQLCKEKNLHTVRINQSGCLGRCEFGPVAVVYPENTWYTFVDKEDIDDIVNNHLKNGQIVERLLVNN